MDRFLLRVLAVVASLAILTWLFVALSRVGHPFELEWQEGGMLAHVERLREGLPLYAEPSLEFAAFPYPPLYHWVGVASASALGTGFVALRLVSILATVCTLVLLAVYATRDGGHRIAGLVAAGVYAATFRWAGAWFDVARVDSLALALVMGAVYVARFRESTRGAALAGVLAAAAFLTKQTALPMVLPLLVPLYRRAPRQAGVFLLTLGLVSAGALGALHVSSDGWSTFYVFDMLRGHEIWQPKVLGFWTQDMIWLVPVICAAIVGLPSGPHRAGLGFVLWPAGGMIAAAWLGRVHPGGYDNTLLPAGLAAGVVAGRLAVGAGLRNELIAAGVAGVLCVQMLVMGYDPRGQIPSAADHAAGERVVRRLSSIEGDVFAPHQGYLARRAGKGKTLHAQGITDLLASTGHGELAGKLVGELEEALSRGRYGALLLARPWEEPPYEFGVIGVHYYRVDGPLAEGPGLMMPGLMMPVTGAAMRPEFWYLARE